MNIRRLYALFIISAICCATAIAATVVTICGDRYVCYTAVEKSSLHRVGRALNVSPEVVLRYNPWAEEGLAKGQTVLVPADKSMIPPVSQADYPSGVPMTYTLGPDENIYTVAQRFDASVEALIAANSSIPPANYEAGVTVTVLPRSATPFTVERKAVSFERYKLQNGDSFYMLAKKNGISESDIMAANPGIEQLKKGKYILIPRVAATTVTASAGMLSENELRNYYGQRIDALYAAAHPAKLKKKSDGNNIAIVLPFQLNKPQPPRQALLYTDFYKGFLIALDSIQRRGDAPRLNLTVLDTEHNLNVTDSLLATGTLDNMDVIIAPLEPKQLERIVNYGAEHDIAVLNCFATKNDDHLVKSNVIQANVPMPMMTAGVVNWVVETMPERSIIYVTDSGVEDAEAFTTLRDNFALTGIETLTIDIGSNELNFSELSLQMLPGSQYLIVPSNGSRSLLKHILPAIKKAKQERYDCEVQLLGYPEYVTYLKDFQTELQDVDTFMFSRFFNSNGYRTRDIEFYYSKWFNGSMLLSYPNMVLYGFDTAMCLMSAFNEGDSLVDHTELVSGIQTPFRFKPAGDDSGSGYVNDAICIVHFTPAHTIETIVR